jgi:hypothetical protein
MFNDYVLLVGTRDGRTQSARAQSRNKVLNWSLVQVGNNQNIMDHNLFLTIGWTIVKCKV